VGEGPSTGHPSTFLPKVNQPMPSSPTVDVPQAPLDVVHELDVPARPAPFIPVLAATKTSVPLRRANSLPPYGPGPTTMYVLPHNMKPSVSRGMSKRPPSIRKRWRPSPGSVRKNVRVVSLKKLQSMTDASFRPPSMGDGNFGRSFGSMKKVAFQPFRKTALPPAETMPETVEEITDGTIVEGSGIRETRTEKPKPPATYKSFMKKSHSEPVMATGKTVETVWRPSFNKPSFRKPSFTKPNFNNAGKWIDQRFDFLAKPPVRQTTQSPTTIPIVPMVESPITSPVTELPELPVAEVATGVTPRRRRPLWMKRNGTWFKTSRRPKVPPLHIIRRGTTMSKAVVRGWDKVLIVGTSFTSVVTSKIPRKRVPITTGIQDVPPVEATVRRVMTEGRGIETVHEGRGARMSLEDSISEEFHTDEEIVEAETVTGEMVLEHLNVNRLAVGKEDAV
jgi:hypothetical protein